MALRRKKRRSALAKKRDNPNSTYWKRKADVAWGRLIHAIGGGCVCKELGDCKGPLEAHHLITRGRLATRHTPANGVLLCSYHHKWSRDCSPHMAPLQFAQFLQERRKDVWTLYESCKVMQSGPESFKDRAEFLEAELARHA